MPQREADGTVLAVLALWHVGLALTFASLGLIVQAHIRPPSWAGCATLEPGAVD